MEWRRAVAARREAMRSRRAERASGVVEAAVGSWVWGWGVSFERGRFWSDVGWLRGRWVPAGRGRRFVCLVWRMWLGEGATLGFDGCCSLGGEGRGGPETRPSNSLRSCMSLRYFAAAAVCLISIPP